jgi:uncharacterized phage protein gp47/JayE
MADFLTFDDLFRAARDEVLARNAKLSKEAVEREGSDANVLIAAACAAIDECVGQMASVSAASFLDSARGKALDRLVFDRYGLVRKPASPALGLVSFSTTATNPTAFSIPAGTLLQSTDGIQFVTTASDTFPAGTTGPVTIPVRSILAGAGQQTKAASITNIVSRITGAPATLTVTNTVATAGATDEETDDLLRERARRFYATAQRGTLSAIEQAALTVAGVQKAVAFEAIDSSGRPARFVMLVVSDAFTESLADLSTSPATYAAQSQQLALSVFNALSDVRPAGVYVQVQVAQVVMQAVQLQLSFQAGVDYESVALEARSVIVGHINELAPGQNLIIAEMLEKLRRVTGLIITGGEIIAPAGNVMVKPLQALRTDLSLVGIVSASINTALLTSTNGGFVFGVAQPFPPRSGGSGGGGRFGSIIGTYTGGG